MSTSMESWVSQNYFPLYLVFTTPYPGWVNGLGDLNHHLPLCTGVLAVRVWPQRKMERSTVIRRPNPWPARNQVANFSDDCQTLHISHIILALQTKVWQQTKEFASCGYLCKGHLHKNESGPTENHFIKAVLSSFFLNSWYLFLSILRWFFFWRNKIDAFFNLWK